MRRRDRAVVRGGAKRRVQAKLVRFAKRVARIVVACIVVLSMFGGAAAPAAAAIVAVSTAPVCHCPHDSDEDMKSCPCCAGDSGGHCLPVGGCASGTTFAPPLLHDALIPVPLETGIVEPPTHRALDGRLIATGLERPPRA